MNTWNSEAYRQHAPYVPNLGAAVLELLAPRPGERILDVGCGEGTLTQQIVDRGATVVGIDSSQDMIDAARARGLDARLANAEALTFDDEFDAVFSNAALHWIRRSRCTARRRCARAPAGRPLRRRVRRPGQHRGD